MEQPCAKHWLSTKDLIQSTGIYGPVREKCTKTVIPLKSAKITN